MNVSRRTLFGFIAALPLVPKVAAAKAWPTATVRFEQQVYTSFANAADRAFASTYPGDGVALFSMTHPVSERYAGVFYPDGSWNNGLDADEA